MLIYTWRRVRELLIIMHELLPQNTFTCLRYIGLYKYLNFISFFMYLQFKVILSRKNYNKYLRNANIKKKKLCDLVREGNQNFREILWARVKFCWYKCIIYIQNFLLVVWRNFVFIFGIEVLVHPYPFRRMSKDGSPNFSLAASQENFHVASSA